jgi:uncharacterized membrane protein
MMASVVANTALPVAVGAIMGALLSVAFILRVTPSSIQRQEQDDSARAERRRALRPVLFLYVAVTWICLVAALAIGELAFIVLSGIMALIASIGLAYVRPFRSARLHRSP